MEVVIFSLIWWATVIYFADRIGRMEKEIEYRNELIDLLRRSR